MLRKNVGGFDRALRFVLGVALILVGLFVLGGRQGNIVGIIVATCALIPLVTSLIGFCPAYIPFRVSTRSDDDARRTRHAAT